MAQFNKIQTLQAIIQTGMVPVYYNKEVEIAKQVVKACYEGGVRAFEFTNRGDFAHEVFGELVKYAAKECPELVLGVGSIVDPATAALFIQLGANFVVGPLFNPEIAKICTVASSLIRPAAVPYPRSALPKKLVATFARYSPPEM